MSANTLWKERSFALLWSSQTLSLIGSQVSFLALPLTAVVLFRVTPLQMGLLMAARDIPALAIGLFAGAWLDKRARRPVLIAADIGRAILLGLIPALTLLGWLQLTHLYLIALLMGALSFFFNVAYRSFLPSLVSTEQLVDGNSKLELSRALAELAGPALGGGLVQVLTAPIAIAVDGVSYLLSAILLSLIRVKESVIVDVGTSLWRDIREGLSFVLGHDLLRLLAGAGALINLFNGMLEALVILFMAEELGLSAGLIGIAFTGGSLGFIVGSQLPPHITRRIGIGPAIITGLLVFGLSDLVLPFIRGSAFTLVGMVIAIEFFFGIGLVLYNSGQVSLRQAVTPDHLLGRMNAIVQVAALTAAPIGALLGGAIAAAIGIRECMIIAAAGEIITAVWLITSPLRKHRTATPSG